MNDNIELRSRKARNIIGKVPSKLVRIGISVISFVFLILVFGSYYFKYPNIYITESTIKTIPNISSVNATQSAKIVYLRQDKQEVQMGDTIAVLYSTKSIDTLIAEINGHLYISGENNVSKGNTIYYIVPSVIKNYYSEFFIPYKLKDKFDSSTRINFEIKGYPKSKYGSIKGDSLQIYSMPIKKDNVLYLRVSVLLLDKLITNQNMEIQYHPNLNSEASIQTGEKSILDRIIESLFSF